MLTPDEQYAANLAALEQQPLLQPLIAQMASSPLTNLQLFPTPSGRLGCCVWDVEKQTWIPVCDLADPVGAAEAAAAQMWSPDHTVYTLMGLGIGYAVAALTKRLLPYQRLVVWDGDAGLFKAMLYCLDVQEIFAGKRVEIYVGPNLLAQLEPWHMRLEVHEKLHMAVPVSHSYTAVYRKAEYAALVAKSLDLFRFHMVGLATWRQFGRHIGDNDLENMPEYYQHPGLTALKGLWQGKPAICVAAGPSLQRNLKLLLPAAQRRKVALLTVGTTYALLQGLGLQPDIVTTIDFQRLNWTDQFQHIPLDPDCSLVYLHSTYPQTVRRWPGPRFVAENASDTLSWIRQWAGDDKGQAGMVQTVAHLNLITALMLGANPIILLGQDLSMPLHEHHAAGSRAQDSAPGDGGAETLLPAVDMQGQPVATRHSFQSMLLVFERIIAEHPDTTFINASEQGLRIAGAQERPLATVLASLPDLPAVAPRRPLFQGESVEALGQREASSLRTALRDVAEAYVPCPQAGVLEGIRAARQQLEEIGDWAAATTRQWAAWQAWDIPEAERHAAQSSDVFTEAETRDRLLGADYHTLAASEAVLAARPHAVGMLVIRRFDFLEVRGEIPPPAWQLQEPWQQARYAAERLVRVAAMFAEELSVVRQLLARVERRLWPASNLYRAIAQQHYRAAFRLLEPWGVEPGRTVGQAAAVLALLYRHTQQYAAALALPLTSAHAARVRHHLTHVAADVREAFPAYFKGTSDTGAERSAPDDDITHAWAVPRPKPRAGDGRAIPATTDVHLNGDSRLVYAVDSAGYLIPTHTEENSYGESTGVQ